MNTYIPSLLALMWVWAMVASEGTPFYKQETDVLKTLVSGYDPEVVPQTNVSVPVKVTISLSLSNILEIDEKKGRMATGLHPILKWNDPRLVWDSSINKVEKTTISSQKIWIPDIEVFNNLNNREETELIEARAVIYNDGNVTYIPFKHVITPCEFNLFNFPFDSQMCMISIGSYHRDAMTIDLQLEYSNESFSVNNYTPLNNWEITETTAKRHLYPYPDGSVYVTTTWNVAMKRHGSYYYRLFVAPAAICMFVIPVIHFLPPSSNEKLTLGGLMLVAIVIMFQMVEDYFPPFSLSTVPLIMHYYTSLLILLFASLLLSCLSVVIGTGTSKSSRVPRFLRICCIDRLGYICCARGRTNRYDYELLHLEKALRYTAQRQTSREEDEEDERELTEVGDNEGEITSNGNNANASEDNGMTEVLKTLINELQYSRYKEQIRTEWLQLAIVIDRTGGLLILLLCCIMTAVITLQGDPK